MRHDVPQASPAVQCANGLRPASVRRVAVLNRTDPRSMRNWFLPPAIVAVLALAAAAPRGSAAMEGKAGPAGVAALTTETPSVPPGPQTEMQGAVQSPPQRAGVVTVPIGGGRTATLLAGFRGGWVPGAGWIVQVGPRGQTQCGPGPPQVLRALCVSW